MPNLENIHYKFFPKSRTAHVGRKLIYGAWFIEIVVALVSLTIAYVIFTTNTNTFGVSSGETTIISLAFVVVAVMELTKIPLVIALYFSPMWKSRLIFIALLLFANYSTFETMIQAFDISVYNQLKKVNVERQLQQNIYRKIELLRDEINIEKKNQDLVQLKIDQKSIIEAKNNLINQQDSEINKILNEYNYDNNILQTLEKNKQEKIVERQQLQALKSAVEQKITEIKGGIFGLGGGANRSLLQTEIEGYKNQIQTINGQLDVIENRIVSAQRQNTNKAGPLLENIKTKYQALLLPIENQLNEINKSLEARQTEISNISSKTEEINAKILTEQENLRKQLETVEERSQESNILRISLRIKNRPVWLGGAGGSYKISDLEEKDLDEAFIYWFGILAFVISIIGSGVAYAGLHLGDERIHQYNNKPGYGVSGIFLRFGRVLITIRKYFLTKLKLLFKPKIVEKIVEVEKIVDRIIEKPVIQEKIIEKEIEVPRQIEKKIFVHVPFPTDDPEVIKKGPMIYNDKDFDKIKK
ncbi:MAG: hypothetical protein O3C64_05620 [Proteobacteria bacterium]|nr:hypothetical protein [Pseudomonadota bacterium]